MTGQTNRRERTYRQGPAGGDDLDRFLLQVFWSSILLRISKSVVILHNKLRKKLYNINKNMSLDIFFKTYAQKILQNHKINANICDKIPYAQKVKKI